MASVLRYVSNFENPLSPPTKGESDEQTVQLQCPDCQTKYGVLLERIAHIELPRFHCSRCDSIFSVDCDLLPKGSGEAHDQMEEPQENAPSEPSQQKLWGSNLSGQASGEAIETNAEASIPYQPRWTHGLSRAPELAEPAKFDMATQPNLDENSQVNEDYAPGTPLEETPLPLSRYSITHAVQAPVAEPSPLSLAPSPALSTPEPVQEEAFQYSSNLEDEAPLDSEADQASQNLSEENTALAPEERTTIPTRPSVVASSSLGTIPPGEFNYTQASVMTLIVPVVVMMVVLLFGSIFSQFAPGAFQAVIGTVLHSNVTTPPDELVLDKLRYQAVTLDSGERAGLIVGNIANQSEEKFQETEIQAAVYDQNGALLSKQSAFAPSALSKELLGGEKRIESFSRDTIEALQRRVRGKSSVIQAGEVKKFAVVVFDDVSAERSLMYGRHFSARVASSQR